MLTLCSSQKDAVKTDSLASTVSTNLTILGLLSSWVAWLIVTQLAGWSSEGDPIPAGGKPMIYYVAHGFGLILIICAGVISCVGGKYREVDPMARVSIVVLAVTAISWALITYGLDDFIDFKAFGATGPFVWLACFSVFAGMEKTLWEKLDNLILGMAYVTSVYAIWGILNTSDLAIDRWQSGHVMNMVLLMWFGGWALLSVGSTPKGKSLLSYFPFMVFVCLAVFTKTRSWLIMAILLLILSLVNKHRSRRSHFNILRTILKTYLVFIMLLFFVLVFQDALLKGAAGLMERGLTDTRTGQYQEFFAQVPVVDLILGRGPKASYFFFGQDYQFLDNSYVWMLFIGGIPILVSYVLLIIRPGVKAFWGGASEKDGAASILVCLWAVVCLGVGTYSLPSLTPFCFLIYLMTGRCFLYLQEQRNS